MESMVEGGRKKNSQCNRDREISNRAMLSSQPDFFSLPLFHFTVTFRRGIFPRNGDGAHACALKSKLSVCTRARVRLRHTKEDVGNLARHARKPRTRFRGIVKPEEADTKSAAVGIEGKGGRKDSGGTLR